ncbi:mediator of RNA polymerase II transcription subunit 8 [Agyrium rufum]|nr:mediator of RNA polymerase II transcription subunit 8 [Agyrium rufum]
MANPNRLGDQDKKALEATRQRLLQLSTSLATLQRNLQQSDPLPQWNSLQQTAMVIAQHLSSTSALLNTHQELFDSMVVYPSPDFPGKTEEGLLGQLLRKKLEPNVEDWAAEGRKTATEASIKKNEALAGGRSGISDGELRDIWSWAGLAANEEARKHRWGSNFTTEERNMGIENVRTGLRRELEDDTSDDESDEEDEDEAEDKDKMDVDEKTPKPPSLPKEKTESSIPPLQMRDVFRFMMLGALPNT